jgi:ABC-type uncharacterized transport system fused permease/ATPase subunit
MEYLSLFLIVVVITALSIVFSILLERYKKVLVFIPAFVLLTFSAYVFLSSLRSEEESVFVLIIFTFVFLLSGLITLIVAAVRYRPQAR